MAAAFGIPVVVIFGSSDPAIWGPWRTSSEIVQSPGGIQAVTTPQVLDALARLRVHCMKELLRLLAYARRYWVHLLGSVILMAIAGAAQGTLALLVRPIFDRVLTAEPAQGLTPLLAKPILGHQFYLEQLVPLHGRTIWTMVAFALVAAFLIKGICDYVGNYLISYAGFSSVTDLRNAVFQKVLRQGADFFEAHSTGQLMSSIMNDIDKVQLATSQMLADFFRQLFAASGCCSFCSAPIGNWLRSA